MASALQTIHSLDFSLIFLATITVMELTFLLWKLEISILWKIESWDLDIFFFFVRG